MINLLEGFLKSLLIDHLLYMSLKTTLEVIASLQTANIAAISTVLLLCYPLLH